MHGPAGSDQAQGGWLPSAIIAGGAAFWGLYWLPLRETEALGVPPIWSVALFNMPGNSVLGGGGGIALMSGISRVLCPVRFFLTVLVAVSPVPLFVLVFGAF